MNVECIIVSPNGLRHQLWIYRFDEYRRKLRLVQYYESERKTKRHRWNTIRRWHIIDHRASDMAREDVPTPDDVKAAVHKLFVEGVKVED